MLVIPALGMLRQEDFKFKASRGYTARPCLKKMRELKEERKGGREGGREEGRERGKEG
jgi:hypothetical protein